jgi:pimeloyl-ACP methyl ester carboxylesterase
MYVSRPDAKIFYQVFGGPPAGAEAPDIFLCPPSQPAMGVRMWKNNIPYLARHFRVASMDPRGNGRSDRPATGYDFDTRYGDLVAVLEQSVHPPFALVGFTCSSMLAVRYVLQHPGSVSHLVLIGGQYRQSLPQPFEEKVARVIRDDFAGWRDRLFTKMYPEPHSLRAFEDHVEWVRETTPEILIEALGQIGNDNVYELLGRVRVPTLLIHGTDDPVVPYSHGQKLAAALAGARLVTFEGGGHGLPARDPVKVNRLIRDFVLDRRVETHTIPRTTERKAPAVLRGRPARRVLWLSSPIGLGHIQRDVAIARRLPRRRPGPAGGRVPG